MSLMFATQLTAVATAVLALFAIVTAVYAVRAFRKQSHEVGLLEEQLRDDRERRKRAQASHVFIWTEIGTDPRITDDGAAARQGLITRIKNTSAQPIYDLVIDWSRSAVPAEGTNVFLVLMPDGQETCFRRYPERGIEGYFGFGGAIQELLSPVARFRDAAGVRWLLDPDGNLDEIPVAKFGAPSPEYSP